MVVANGLHTAPNISKLLPNWAIAGTRPKVDAFGPLFLRKNNILECQVIDEQNKEIALLKGTAIVRKRNCFHSFSFVAPEHPAGRVWIRARYKDRDFGEARPFEYWRKSILFYFCERRVFSRSQIRTNEIFKLISRKHAKTALRSLRKDFFAD